MTVKEWKEELDCYDDDAEVRFDISADFEPESVTEDRYGNKQVHLNGELKEWFISEVGGDCRVELDIKEEL